MPRERLQSEHHKYFNMYGSHAFNVRKLKRETTWHIIFHAERIYITHSRKTSLNPMSGEPESES